MKVPDSLIYSIFQQQDERLRRELTRKTVEIATGKRVQDLSDDPVATFNILRLKKDIAELSQFSRNRLFADTNLSYIDTTLSKIADKIMFLYTKTVQAKNQIQTPDNLKVASKEFTEGLGFLLVRANERVGENYIFSGSALTTRPFSDSLTYQGSDEEFRVQIGESNLVEVFPVGREVFSTNVYELDTLYSSPQEIIGTTGTMNVSYDSITVSIDYGRGVWYLTQKVENPDVPLSVYGIGGDLILYDSAMNELARISNYEQYSLNELANQINTLFGAQNINASVISNPDGTYTLKLTDGDTPPDNFIEDTSGIILEGNTPESIVKAFNALSTSQVRAYLHQVPSGEYTLRLIPSDTSTYLSVSFSGTPLGNFTTRNVFQLIARVRDKLAAGLSPDESDLTAVKRSYDRVTQERARLGSILSQVKQEESVQENKMDVLRKQRSDTEEVEISESIMEYTRYRIAYEALMRIVADSRNLTILRYI